MTEPSILAAENNSRVINKYNREAPLRKHLPYSRDKKWFEEAIRKYQGKVTCSCGGSLLTTEITVTQFDKPDRVLTFCEACAQVSIVLEEK